MEERIRYLVSYGKAEDKDIAMPWMRAIGQAMVLVGLALFGVGILARTAEAAVVGCLL